MKCNNSNKKEEDTELLRLMARSVYLFEVLYLRKRLKLRCFSALKDFIFTKKIVLSSFKKLNNQKTSYVNKLEWKEVLWENSRNIIRLLWIFPPLFPKPKKDAIVFVEHSLPLRDAHIKMRLKIYKNCYLFIYPISAHNKTLTRKKSQGQIYIFIITWKPRACILY